MKYDKSDVERHIGLQGMHLSAFGDYFWKRERSFNNMQWGPDADTLSIIVYS